MLDPNEVLAAAQELSRKGMSVIPLHAKKKTPAITEWKTFQSAIASPHKLIEWFANDSRNLGIVTGAVSNVVVVDVDQLEGLQTIDAMPHTPTVVTGKGKHFYFRHPGFDVKNIKLDGLGDVRGDGGYVVTAPSIHENGKRYTWEIGPETPLAHLPKWLLEKLQQTEVPQAGTSDSVTTAYGKRWFDDVEELALAREGGRNMMLNNVACKAGSLIEAGELNDFQARSAMIDACKRNGLVYDEASGGLKAVHATMKSGLAKGRMNPRERLKSEETVPVFKGGKLQLRRASSITPEKIDWLWKGVLAKGHISLIAGDAGTGKSSLSLSLAAIVSTGGKWPVTGEAVKPGNVIILSREDRAEDVIVPRLIAAGADLDRVLIVGDVGEGEDARDFKLTTDMPRLAEACRDIGEVSLIICDPVSSYMGDGDMNKQTDVRLITNPLMALAQEYMASVVMITHNNKSTNVGAGAKVLGSGAWVQASRTVFSVTKDDETGIRTMAPAKNNIAKDDVAYCYTIHEATIGPGITASFVQWENYTTTRTADQVLAEKQDGPMVAIAKDFLCETVRYRRLASSEVKRLAADQGIAPRTLSRAKDALGISSEWDQKSAQYVFVWPKAKALELEPEIAPFDPTF